MVTGGNGGIGLGIAAALGAAGASIAVWARNRDKTARALDQLGEAGVRAVGIGCDVTDEGEVRLASAGTVEQLGRLDICVANAGVPQRSPFLETTLEAWNEGLASNLSGAFLCFR